jgi:hypothetical protein
MQMPPKEKRYYPELPAFQTRVTNDPMGTVTVPAIGRDRSIEEVRENWFGKTAMPKSGSEGSSNQRLLYPEYKYRW